MKWNFFFVGNPDIHTLLSLICTSRCSCCFFYIYSYQVSPFPFHSLCETNNYHFGQPSTNKRKKKFHSPLFSTCFETNNNKYSQHVENEQKKIYLNLFSLALSFMPHPIYHLLLSTNNCKEFCFQLYNVCVCVEPIFQFNLLLFFWHSSFFSLDG